MNQGPQKRASLESLAIDAAAIAHDFNNLLTSIMGHLTLARMDAPTGAMTDNLVEAEKACLRARDKAAQLSALVAGVETANNPPPAEPGPPKAPARILVMDDEESIRILVARMLTNNGFQVETVSDGSEAILRYMEALDAGRRFDAVLLDLRVPRGTGGFEAYQAIRAADANVKAILSSGHAENPVMAEYEKHGISAVIPKPYTAQQLMEAVRKIFGTARAA